MLKSSNRSIVFLYKIYLPNVAKSTVITADNSFSSVIKFQKVIRLYNGAPEPSLETSLFYFLLDIY